MKIYKYPLKNVDRQSIDMPKGGKILSFKVQHRTPTLWVLVDPSAETESRNFVIYGTGHEINLPLELITYIGSIQQCGGEFIWHLFEITPKEPKR